MKKKKATKSPFTNPDIENRKARFEYNIEEVFEAGLELKGSEVKSVRMGKVDMTGAYAYVENGEMFLINVTIQPYTHASAFSNLDPKRKRKLLLKKQQILKIHEQVKQKRKTIVPLKFYFTRGMVKVKIAIASGKQEHDKRRDIKKRDLMRQARTEV
jgi:SsrA-binding protein